VVRSIVAEIPRPAVEVPSEISTLQLPSRMLSIAVSASPGE